MKASRLAEYNPDATGPQMTSLAKAAERLGSCVGFAKSLAATGILPATQAMKDAQLPDPDRTIFALVDQRGAQMSNTCCNVLHEAPRSVPITAEATRRPPPSSP